MKNNILLSDTRNIDEIFDLIDHSKLTLNLFIHLTMVNNNILNMMKIMTWKRENINRLN